MSYTGTMIDDLDSLIDHIFGQVRTPVLSTCDYSGEYCDCRDRACVTLLETEEGLCLRHFYERLKS